MCIWPSSGVWLHILMRFNRRLHTARASHYSLALGKIMHKFHSGNLPDNFNHLFTRVNQVHCHAMRSATRGAYFWQMAHTKYGRSSLRHLGPNIWDKIDPSLHDSSQLTFKKQYKDVLISAYDDRWYGAEKWVLYVNCIPFHLTYSPLPFRIAHFPLNIFPPLIAIFIPYF